VIEATSSFGGTIPSDTLHDVECGDMATPSNQFGSSMPGFEVTWSSSEVAAADATGTGPMSSTTPPPLPAHRERTWADGPR